MNIGTDDDRRAVTAMFPIGGTLHAIKEQGIYAIKLADQIDRTPPESQSLGTVEPESWSLK